MNCLLLLSLALPLGLDAQALGFAQDAAAPHLSAYLTNAPHAAWRAADAECLFREAGLDFDLIKAMQGRSAYPIDVHTSCQRSGLRSRRPSIK